MSSTTFVILVWGVAVVALVCFVWGYALGRKDENEWWRRYLNG